MASDDKDKEVYNGDIGEVYFKQSRHRHGTPRSFTVVSLRRTGMAMAKLGIDGIRYLGV